MAGEEIIALMYELDDIRKIVGGKKLELGKDGKPRNRDREDIEILGDQIDNIKSDIVELKKTLEKLESKIGQESSAVDDTAKLLTEKLKESSDELQKTLFDVTK